jgi:hypothetical protein
MSEAQNRNMGRKRRQGNMTPQKTENNVTEHLVEREADEFPVADLRRMMIRLFNELKEELERRCKNSMDIKRTWKKSQKDAETTK